jgi:hypothetical protein
MPLVNSPTLTPKKLAANRANAQRSRGPVTLEGLIRVRDSNIKHGLYARESPEALRARPADWAPDGAAHEARNGEAEHSQEKNQNMQNEGESHDVVDNKG